ncbi:MAG: hypothetical protein D6802_10070 [Ardenticatenia bacterium]|nr:MAG: hypothetical protein D6802_10070 [Ardenticatenia bacterium]
MADQHLFRLPKAALLQSTPHNRRALLDFGSSGARALLISLTPEGALVLGSGTASGNAALLGETPTLSPNHLSSLSDQALTDAEHHAHTLTQQAVVADHGQAVISGTWLKGSLFVQKQTRAKPTESLDRDELRPLIARLSAKAHAYARTESMKTQVRHTIFDAELVGLLLDLLPVQRWGSRGGTTLVLALNAWCWPSTGLDALEEIFARVGLELEAVKAAPHVVAAQQPYSDAVLIDVGVQHTDVALVEQRRITAFASMPHGLAHIAAALDWPRPLPPHAAWAAFEQYMRGLGSQEGRAFLESALPQALQHWLETLQSNLRILAGKEPLPSRVWVYGGGARLPALLHALQAYAWPHRLFAGTPVFDVLKPARLQHLYDMYGLLTGPEWVNIAALAAEMAREPETVEADVLEMFWQESKSHQNM